MFFFSISSIKYTILFLFLILYFFLIIVLISYIFFFNLINLKFISELKTSNIHVFEYILISLFLSFTGIPPFFFFFPKYSLLSNILISGFFINIIFCLILLFLSWYMYFSTIRYIILLKDTKNKYNFFFLKKQSSFLLIFLFFSFFFLFFGFFFIYDIYLYIYYLFAFLC